jgi:hypothetical protein
MQNTGAAYDPTRSALNGGSDGTDCLGLSRERSYPTSSAHWASADYESLRRRPARYDLKLWIGPLHEGATYPPA